MARHVLLIEDEPNIAEAIRFLLGREGLTVSSLADGTHAAEAVRTVMLLGCIPASGYARRDRSAAVHQHGPQLLRSRPRSKPSTVPLPSRSPEAVPQPPSRMPRSMPSTEPLPLMSPTQGGTVTTNS